MRLIAATPVFAPVFARMHAETFPRPWSETEFRTLLSSPGVFGLLAETTEADPSGFALCRVAADEMEILTIGVRPPCRRHGVAHRLLRQALETAAAAGAAQAFLEVSIENHAAVALYTAHEFQISGIRKRYYLEFIDGMEVRVDAYIMSRTLRSLDALQ